jgi:hypothetical protein
MPDNPNQLYTSISAGKIPEQTMAFVNYYRAKEIYPNEKPTVAVLLTAPSDGESYDLKSPWVRLELDRISKRWVLLNRLIRFLRIIKFLTQSILVSGVHRLVPSTVKQNRFGNQGRLRFQLTTIQFGHGCIE